MTVTGVFDGVHVGYFPSHVGDEAELAVWVFYEFLLEVVDVHDVIVVGFNIDGLFVDR